VGSVGFAVERIEVVPVVGDVDAHFLGLCDGRPDGFIGSVLRMKLDCNADT
jgi:hypothetical protein